MGLTTSLSNALAGLSASQDSLAVVSRNVSNAGTPGYHAQSLQVVDRAASTSTYVDSGEVTRAFNQTLQTNYNRQVSQSGFAAITASFLDRLQTYLGKPGDTGSLDTVFGNFQSALQALSTSPDDYATRATFMSAAQGMASTLNTLSSNVQGLRQDAESRITSDVAGLNTALKALQDVNSKLSTLGDDGATRATLMDQRDRLVGQVANLVDLRVDYRADGTVALSTQSGVGLLDVNRATLDFRPAGQIAATQHFSADQSQNGVGTLTLTTASGLTIDLVANNVIRGGELGGLLNLRDKTLVDAQSQLDEVAAGLAQAFSTNVQSGQPSPPLGSYPLPPGTPAGYSIDLSPNAAYPIQDGNDFVIDYTEGGISKTAKIVRVDDTGKLPLDYTNQDGVRVIGLDFSGGAASVASQLQAKLGDGLQFSASGSQLTVLDDGNGGLTNVTGVSTETTATGASDGTLGLNLFVDAGNGSFTNNLDGATQKLGFAGRIALNAGIVANNALLVQYAPDGAMGDASRVNQAADQLTNARFSAAQTQTNVVAAGGLNGTVTDLIAQTMNYQGDVVSSALSNQDTQTLAMNTLQQRMGTEYGVNVDEEMSRLIELQNAYAANARVVSVIQTLIDTLMKA